MRRIYWDSMLLIYLLDGRPKYSSRVVDLLEVSIRREDRLFTSYLGLGELMAGGKKSSGSEIANHIQRELDDIGFSYLPFDGSSVSVFASLRAV